jgi:hypothetical protein
MTKIEQWTATPQYRHNLRLIPPLAEEFSVYGGKDTVERARAWALDGHYLLADGIPKCAHGLYLLDSCPGSTCRSRFPQLDHASVWVPTGPTAEVRPFLLSHPYAKTISDDTSTYAKAHGLTARSYPEFGDGWYGGGTIPVRFTMPAHYPFWPIEAETLTLLATQPVAWPDDDEEAAT